MKNFFLPELSQGALAKLRNAAVPLCDFVEDGTQGVVVEEADMTRALVALGVEVASEAPTSYEGIVRVTLRSRSAEAAAAPAPKPAATATVAGWDGNNSSGFQKAAEEILVPVLRRDIVLDVPHRNFRAPAQDGRFHIHIWSSPSGDDGGQEVPSTMWGIKVDCKDSGFAPSGQGQAIVEDRGWPVAEVVGGNLYIHHDICHYGTAQELAIFRRLLEEVIFEVFTPPEQKAEVLRRRAQERRERSRAAYIKECSQRFEKTVAGTKKAIADGEAEVVRLQQALVVKIREVAGAKRKLEQIELCRGGELEKYGEEFDKLLAVPKVVDLQVADGVVKVFTDILFCTDPRDRVVHEIGKFRIELYTNGANGGVRWYNLTRRVSDHDAPHVNQGSACFGNTAEIFPELIANYEFAAAAMVAIQFVESVNTDDTWGRTISDWPVADDPAASKSAG